MSSALTGAASALILGLLLATAYGTLFHFLLGGPIQRIPVYIVASMIGFAIGHFVGSFLGVGLLKLGTLQMLTASIGSWVALFIAWWLAGR